MDIDPPQAKFRAHNPHSKRIYRACIYCRQRKTRCDLDSNGVQGSPPCQRCIREGRECVLGESNRGRRPKKANAQVREMEDDQMSQSNDGTVAVADDGNAFAGIQNPSDALGILAQVADNDHHESSLQNGSFQQLQPTTVSPRAQPRAPFESIGARAFEVWPEADMIPYQLCSDGLLTTQKVRELVARYAKYYHPYFPIVPGRVLALANLAEVALNEQHLLTAIITIASKDLVDDVRVYEVCSEYMQKLISALVIGMKCGVEAVEAFLILAEWTPHQESAVTGSIGRGEEDRAAWMYVGMALRVGYYLGLDLTSFRSRNEPRDELFLRHRLVWAACYMSDRQISLRIGKAFWSRGPGPLSRFTLRDFPTLQTNSPRDENYGSIFQATLELTQLFTNVHEILYTHRGSRLKALLEKDYIRYIDDFRTAIKAWNSVWGTLTCSPNLKSTLLISYDYLRLYTNAFALQATFNRKTSPKNKQRHQRSSFISIASVPDARFIYEALDAAKSLLVTVNNFVDPKTCLRYMPLRFYLYIIYSAVFLYKARFLTIGSAEETRAIRDLIKDTIEGLQRASVGTHHLGSRYARLLKRLWRKGESDQSPPELQEEIDGGHISAGNDFVMNQNQSSQLHSGYGDVTNSPIAMQSYDFNWLDLDAVGQFVMDDSLYSANLVPDVEAMWLGFGVESPEVNLTEDTDSVGQTGGYMFF